MKVRTLVSELLKFDQNKEVYIQQGEESDYMLAFSVKEKELLPDNYWDDDKDILKNAIVIEYY